MSGILYVLPNGYAVDPSIVRTVQWVGRSIEPEGPRERVVLHLSQNPGSVIVYCESLEEAEKLCTKIVREINGLRE